MDVDSISSVAQDYVKAIWSATEWGDPPITTKALAARFGTSAANVTDTMRRLASQGLITYEPYKPVRLTETGTKLAVVMVRRHRLLETFLVTTLGYRWDEVHDEAERLEHAATDLLIERIDVLLGHPTADPHGDPIPTESGVFSRENDVVRLTDAGAGRHVVRRVSDADPRNLDAAGLLGILPGRIIDVCLRNSAAGAGTAAGATALLLHHPGGERPIPDALAAATWTSPAPNGR